VTDTFNAFIFCHGLASPTLADIVMLTGLDITHADDGGIFNHNSEYKVETHNIGGYSGYVQKYRQTRIVGHREHTIFLNMWLNKFIFCG